MIYPSADIIEERVGSRYSLVVVAAKRAKQIKEGAPVLIETASTNPLTIALEEIAAGKVTVGEALVIASDHILENEESTPPPPPPPPMPVFVAQPIDESVVSEDEEEEDPDTDFDDDSVDEDAVEAEELN